MLFRISVALSLYCQSVRMCYYSTDRLPFFFRTFPVFFQNVSRFLSKRFPFSFRTFHVFFQNVSRFLSDYLPFSFRSSPIFFQNVSLFLSALNSLVCRTIYRSCPLVKFPIYATENYPTGKNVHTTPQRNIWSTYRQLSVHFVSKIINKTSPYLEGRYFLSNRKFGYWRKRITPSQNGRNEALNFRLPPLY